MIKNNQIDEIDLNLLPSFIIESTEHIERLIEILLILEENPEAQDDHIDELFRIAHQIKGSAAIVGLNDLNQAFHEVENLLDQVRENINRLEKPLINLLLEFANALEATMENQLNDFNKDYWIARFKKFNPETEKEENQPTIKPDVPLILSKEEKAIVASWQEQNKIVYGIELLFSQEAPFRSAATIAFHNYLQRFGEILTMAPPFSQLSEENFAIFKVVLLKEKPLSLEEQDKIMVFPINDGVERVYIREWTYRKEESGNLGAGDLPSRTIRVSTTQIDYVMKQLRELVSIKTSLNHISSLDYQDSSTWKELNKSLKNLEDQINTLQFALVELRMVPLKQLFSRFTNSVRNIARQAQKKIKLEFRGEDIKIDREVAEQLIDPLTHLIRNAIDHGVETPEERRKAGKEVVGNILLEARQEGKYILISVKDDGRGLNLPKILETSVTKEPIEGNISLSPNDIHNIKKIIFTPGFSTTQQANNLSGRGVGLDIVKHNVEQLQGIIEIETQENHGTTFTLKIPFSAHDF
jgi:two-component system chemotaxis sensor kinase CheA